MEGSKDILSEYFDSSTSIDRKAEIKKMINAGADEDAKILVDLKDSVDVDLKLNEFKQRLKNLEAKKSRWTPMRVAASIAFLILGSFALFLLLYQNKQAPKVVFETYYTPYDGYVNLRGSENLFANGIHAYELEMYQEALDIFLQVETDSSNLAQRNLLISSCYLALNNPEASLQYLVQIDDNQSKLIISNRDWYRSLSYLSMEQLEKSQALLESLIESKTPFAAKSKSLLNEPIFHD